MHTCFGSRGRVPPTGQKDAACRQEQRGVAGRHAVSDDSRCRKLPCCCWRCHLERHPLPCTLAFVTPQRASVRVDPEYTRHCFWSSPLLRNTCAASTHLLPQHRMSLRGWHCTRLHSPHCRGELCRTPGLQRAGWPHGQLQGHRRRPVGFYGGSHARQRTAPH